MIVLIAWLAAVLFTVLLLGIVGFDLLGRIRRLQRAQAAVRGQMLPQVRGLLDSAQRGQSAGRHSANTG